MEILGYLAEAATLQNLLWLTMASLLGALLGALPGISATTAIAIFLPITYGLDPTTGLITMAAIYVTGSYGGNITAVLLNTPGTDDSLFMTFDGYPMTVKGEGLRAVGITTYSAFIGGIIGGVALLFIAPPLARIAIMFGPVELFLTSLMGIVIIVGLTKGGMLKGLISAAFGLLCAVVGLDKITGMPRFDFGVDQLYDSLPLIPVLLGLFAVSQVLLLTASESDIIASEDTSEHRAVFIKLRDHLKLLINNIRSSIIGTMVGIIPAAGTTVSAGITYNISKKLSKHPETFGHGNEHGLASVSATNNAVVGGSLVPLLSLGIPGNGTAALFLGALLIHGLSPGARLFTTNAEAIYGMIFGLIAANFFILVVGLYGARLYAKVTKIPKSILIPVVGAFIVLGAYLTRYLAFDMFLILFFGLIGYYMILAGFSMAPFVLAFILGKLVETQFRRALQIYGEDFVGHMLTDPISLILLSVNILFLLLPFWEDIRKVFRRRTPSVKA